MSATDAVQKTGEPPTRSSAGVSRPLLGLQCVSACAGTMLGSVVGSGTIGKLLASAGGAVIAAFLTAPGRHHSRRIVAVGLLLALLDEGKALAAAVRHSRRRARRTRRARASVVSRPANLLVTAGVAVIGFGAGWAVAASPVVASSSSGEAPIARLVASRSHQPAHHTGSTASVVTPAPRRTLVSVPQVVGLRQSNAITLLLKAGFKATTTSSPSPTVASGLVISSVPGAGARAAKASTVTLVMSTGAPATVTVAVPDVTGDPVTTAVHTLETAGFVTSVSTRASAMVPVGHVINTAPSAGQTAPKGATVKLIQSTGPATVAVPDVVGDTVGVAQTTLEQAGFRTSTSTQPSPTIASGSVISTNPSGGSQAAAGSSIQIVVSSGRALVTVPDVTGQPLKVALATLRAAGFAPTVSGQSSNTVPLNDVITTTPAPSSQAVPGSTVDVVVSH